MGPLQSVLQGIFLKKNFVVQKEGLKKRFSGSALSARGVNVGRAQLGLWIVCRGTFDGPQRKKALKVGLLEGRAV